MTCFGMSNLNLQCRFMAHGLHMVTARYPAMKIFIVNGCLLVAQFQIPLSVYYPQQDNHDSDHQ